MSKKPESKSKLSLNKPNQTHKVSKLPDKSAKPIPESEKQEIVIPSKGDEKKASKPIETNLKEMINLIFQNPESKEPCYSVFDETTRVSAFLRHRNTCYLDVFDKDSIIPDRIRLSVISSIRFGKPLVFDFLNMVDLLDILIEQCSKVSPDLFKELCDRSILKDNNFLKYVKESDGEDYKSYQFTPDLNENFKVVFLFTKPSEKLFSIGKAFIIGA